jgi:hypothetical protein
MLVGFNSNVAASSLVRDCAVDPTSVFPVEDLQEDHYVRGCMLTAPRGVKGSVTGFGTEWRRSDSAVCVAAMRIAECGCGVDTDGDGDVDITDPQELGLALIPPQPQEEGITLRGFPLGTWSGFVAGDIESSQLTAGCHYVDTGDGSQTIVSCDLTGTDILNNQNDVKNACRTMYGDNVVVHVPIPNEAIVCEKPDGPFAGDQCSDTPWVVE